MFRVDRLCAIERSVSLYGLHLRAVTAMPLISIRFLSSKRVEAIYDGSLKNGRRHGKLFRTDGSGEYKEYFEEGVGKASDGTRTNRKAMYAKVAGKMIDITVKVKCP